MPIKGTIIAAQTTATVLASGAWGQTTLDVLVRNADSGTVYVGGSDVGTASAGFALTPNSSLSIMLLTSDVLYGLATTGTVQVQALIRGVP